MADATAYEDVPLAASKVWNIIGDFANIRNWAVIVQDQQVEEEPSGTVRALTMADGRVVKEALIATSQYSYTYTMVDNPNVEDYRSTIAVIPLDDSNCRIELIVHVGKSGSESNEELAARYTRFVRGNLKAMKKALGLA